MGRFQKFALASALIAGMLAAPPAAHAQGQDLDSSLQSDNAQGKGTDLLKIAFWILTRVVLPLTGIAIAAYGIGVGAKKGEWFQGLMCVGGGLVLALLPALLGHIMNVDLYQLFGAITTPGGDIRLAAEAWGSSIGPA